MRPLIYVLCDPRDGHAYYVGYTKNFANRMQYHYRDRKWNKNRIQCLAQPWLLELAELGLMPVSKPLEWITPDMDWEEREIFWIATLRKDGEPLLNGTGGGYGTLGRHWKLSPERCKQISERNKQAWLNRTDKQRAAALAVLEKGRRYDRHPELDGPHTSEHRKSIATGLKKAYAEGRRKREWSEEAKQHAAEGMRRYWSTRPESEKQAAAKKMHETRWKR